MMHKAWSSIEEVPYCFWRSSVKFQGHSAKKNRRFSPKLGFLDRKIDNLNPIWVRLLGRSQLSNPSDLPCYTQSALLQLVMVGSPRRGNLVHIEENLWAFLAATKQLQECFFFRPSVCLSVCHTFFTMFSSSYHHEIFRSDYQWQKWRPCKRSRSEVKGQGHRGRSPT